MPAILSSHSSSSTFANLKDRLFWCCFVLLIMGALLNTAHAQAGDWTWMGGGSGNNLGVYGTLGVPAAANIPGRRGSAASWTDNNGNLWLFSGDGSPNDLWEFKPAIGQWAWMSGSSSNYSQGGVYGALGVPAAGNVPGTRDGAVTWTDSSGNFWLFGGSGRDAAGNLASLNDLWEFNPVTNLWAWMGGSSTATYNPVTLQYGQSGVYGTLGVPAAGNVAGGRFAAVSWTDSGGNFWLFGGVGVDSAGAWAPLNDLWEFNPFTGEWAWMGGSSTVVKIQVSSAESHWGRLGVYGTLGVPAAGNIPGSRYAATSWTDSSGNLWLFGGFGFDSAGTWGCLNDLWEFTPSSGEWAWMGGSSTIPSTSGNGWGQPGVYGALGTPAAGNVPGGRSDAISWTDNGGSFWLFGGYGYDSAAVQGYLNDLWKFDPSTGEWAWMGGANTLPLDAYGGSTEIQPVYGKLGVPAVGNNPGSREDAASWVDSSGNFWLFGGRGCFSCQDNDFWRYQPSAGTPRAAKPVFNVRPGVYDSAQLVTISDATPGATVHCTTDGTPPTSASMSCNDPIAVNFTETIQAIAVAGGYANSAVASATYIVNAAATPVFSVASGIYPAAQTVAISDATLGTVIYYTTDGATPTTSSTPYMGPITVSAPETVKAIAAASGYSLSAVAGATYVILPPAAVPTFSVPSGRYLSVQTVTISDATPGAQIYYTMDGTTPTTTSTLYSGPITVDSTKTIQVLVVADGYYPSTASASYTINLPVLALGQWGWMGGSNVLTTHATGQNYDTAYGVPGTYGTLGLPAVGNIPGGRYEAAIWTDGNGNFWLFGGYGWDSAGNVGYLDDLWEFNPSTQQWAWMGGSSTLSCTGSNCGQPGAYGTPGSPAASNVPGGRSDAASWIDNRGNFWLFGGHGWDSTGKLGSLNDLWEFSPSQGQWAWMGGSNVVPVDQWGNGLGQPGVYGTLGTAAAGNIPGGRYGALNWTASDGTFWLFSGAGYDSAAAQGYLNDLWAFNPSTNQWTWVGGSNTVPIGDYDGNGYDEYQPGVYGTLGTPAPDNIPGGRVDAVTWADRSGNLWLFGGYGSAWCYGEFGNQVSTGDLDDVWRFSPAIGQWTWMGGSATMQETRYYTGAPGIQGTLATPEAGNIPDGRGGAAGWTDNSGNFWLFGGTSLVTWVDDLWVFNPSQLGWAWMGSIQPRSDSLGDYFPPLGVYGVMGAPAAGNIPGGRFSSASWTDKSGNLWLFGGSGVDVGGQQGTLNDLWEYQLPAPALAINPPSMALNFNTQLVGRASTAQYIVLRNTGQTALQVGPAVSSNPGVFIISDQAGSCSTGMSLPPMWGCVLRVTFTPAAPGAVHESVGINSVGAPNGAYTVAVSGTGQPLTPAATLNRNALTFLVPQTVGVPSPAQYVQITSKGTAALQVTGITLGGANPQDFSVSNQAGTCATAVTTLVYHASCNLRIIFTPSALGTRTATLYITDSASGSPQAIALSGSGRAPTPLTVSTTSLTFNPAKVGFLTVAQYVQLKNRGVAPVKVSSATLSGDNPGDFVLTNQAGSCTTGATLVPGASCNLRVQFFPQAIGARDAVITVLDNSSAGQYTVTVSGTGN
jgi:N-acetylneuraminic acid mutarotase